jgi:hypothetical protein
MSPGTTESARDPLIRVFKADVTQMSVSAHRVSVQWTKSSNNMWRSSMFVGGKRCRHSDDFLSTSSDGVQMDVMVEITLVSI